MQEKQGDTDLQLLTENKTVPRVQTLNLCHGPGNLSSLEPKGNSRPRLGLKPNSTQQGLCLNSLEEVLLFLETTGLQ